MDTKELAKKFVSTNRIKPDEIVAGCVAVFKNVFKDPDYIVKTIENVVNQKDSGIVFQKAEEINMSNLEGYKESSKNRTNYHLNLTKDSKSNDEFKKIHDECEEVLKKALNWYVNYFQIGVEIYINEPFNLLRYESSQEYKSHYDGTTLTKRSISPIFYINDNYDGGELKFKFYDVEIKPEAGTLVLFPSNYAYNHIAKPVLSGTKYAIVTWLHDRE